LEALTDGLRWVEIDDRANDTSLNSKRAISTSSISEDFQKEFGRIHLRLTRKNGSDGDYLEVNGIKFLEVLKESKASTLISLFS
jgi:hypothetical protein